MAKTRPAGKKSKKSRQKSVLNTVSGSPSSSSTTKKSKATPSPTALLAEATSLLQTGEPAAALPLAQQALDLLSQPASSSTTQSTSPSSSTNSTSSADLPVTALPALSLLAEIAIELGDIPTAHSHFLSAASLDPHGTLPASLGGGPEKFLWLAQLSPTGGQDSLAWYDRGISALTTQITALPPTSPELAAKKRALATALCAAIEVHMTDLSHLPTAEASCESLIAAALLHAPSAPEPLQTLASIRISQLRFPDARAALTRSLELWRHIPPGEEGEDGEGGVPDFPTRVSLARLLLEVGMEGEAIEVLERLVGEDDQSVEVWYLGGWGLWLMGEKNKSGETDQEGGEGKGKEKEKENEEDGEDWKVLWIASREWLQNCLKLYDLLEWEDERLKEHALELVDGLNEELGAVGADDGSDEDDNASLEAEWEDEDTDGDLEMEGT